MIGKMGFGGTVIARKNEEDAPLLWKVRNWLRPIFIVGWLNNLMARVFSDTTGIPTLIANLAVRRWDSQRSTWINYGVVCHRVVTSAGVGFLVDDWDDSTTDITTMNFHAAGTGTTAEASGDTALETEATSVTDRAAGTKSQPAANQLRTVATLSFTGTAAITEHGILSVITEGAGVLWDRSVFSAINVGNGDSIEFTYTCTVNAGG